METNDPPIAADSAYTWEVTSLPITPSCQQQAHRVKAHNSNANSQSGKDTRHFKDGPNNLTQNIDVWDCNSTIEQTGWSTDLTNLKAWLTDSLIFKWPLKKEPTVFSYGTEILEDFYSFTAIRYLVVLFTVKAWLKASAGFDGTLMLLPAPPWFPLSHSDVTAPAQRWCHCFWGHNPLQPGQMQWQLNPSRAPECSNEESPANENPVGLLKGRVAED